MPVVNVAGVSEIQVASRNISICYIQEFYLINAMSVESVSNENAIFTNIYGSTSTSECNGFNVRISAVCVNLHESLRYNLIYFEFPCTSFKNSKNPQNSIRILSLNTKCNDFFTHVINNII